MSNTKKLYSNFLTSFCVFYRPDITHYMLLISFYKSLCTRTLFRTGKGSNNCDIDIGAAYEALGEEK